MFRMNKKICIFPPLLCCALLAMPSSCCRQDGSGDPRESLKTGSGSSASASPGCTFPKTESAPESMPANGEGESWFIVPELEKFLPGIQSEAIRAGFAAAWVCPDPDTGECFLSVARDEASARRINGFFYWLSGRPEDDVSAAPLVLGIDRLFPESGWSAAVSGMRYSEPAVEKVLDYSMKQILGEDYHPDMLDFILSCYRKDFRQRLDRFEQTNGEVFRKAFGRIEVNYHASIFSSVSFRIIPQ